LAALLQRAVVRRVSAAEARPAAMRLSAFQKITAPNF
jgi:hypothetical protein